MSTSKLQEATKERLHMLLEGFNSRENYRPDWLTYPPTGRRLELDFYMPDVKVAIEVQGRQHDEYVPFFHPTEADFEERQRKDAFKREACRREDVFLYEVRDIEDVDEFLEAAKDHCGSLYGELYKKHTALKSLSYYAAHMAEVHHRPHNKGQREEMAALSEKIIVICLKYNIRLDSVRADFYTSRHRMGYAGKPFVKLHRVDDSGIIFRSQKAPVLFTEGSSATIRIAEGEPPLDVEFDLDSGLCLSDLPQARGWRIHKFIHMETDAAGQPIGEAPHGYSYPTPQAEGK